MAKLVLVLACCLTEFMAAAQEQTPAPVDLPPETVQSQYLLKRVAPIYPPLARQARIQGTVTLRIIISKTGDVRQLQLISGHPMLAPAAIDAVRQWKYKPYEVNGEPVEVLTNVQLNFALTNNPPTVIQMKPAEQTAANPPRRIRVSAGVASGLLQHKVPPEYPREAREQNIQGVVILRANIDTQGNVYKLEVVSGDPTLAAAAIDAVKQWKYRPFLLNGEPMEVETQVQVKFTLSQD